MTKKRRHRKCLERIAQLERDLGLDLERQARIRLLYGIQRELFYGERGVAPKTP